MFTELLINDRLLKALDRLSFTKPTLVQQQAIPPALAGKDLQVEAETGSGKTAAYLLPVLQRLHVNPAPRAGTRALILVPTRELAQQVLSQCTALASYTYVKAMSLTGGDSFKFQAASLRKNPEILVSTPGRLVDHLNQGTAELNDIEVLVLDEADRMLDMGFREDFLRIVQATPAARQTLLFSATMEQKGLKSIIRSVLAEPTMISVNTARQPKENITQQIILADDVKHKEKLLAALLKSEAYQKAIVFSNTREQADKLGGWLRYNKLKVGVLHGGMTQEERNLVVKYLREGRLNILLASDVAARGIDIKGIELVVNFAMARTGDDYVHRIGRTGRIGEQGKAVALISPSEWNLMVSIERYLNLNFERRVIKGLEGAYKGPKKVKSSGKATGRKKKPANKKAASAVKKRAKDKQSDGKRPSPSRKKPPVASVDTGFEPLRRKK